MENFELVKVSGSTSTKNLAACVFAAMRKEEKPGMVLRGVGASAFNQMGKAYAKAKQDLAGIGIKLMVDIQFADVPDRDDAKETISAMELVITKITL